MGPEEDPPETTALHLVGLGPLAPGLLPELAARISRRVGLPCRVADHSLAADLPRIPGRDQVDADRLLAGLEARPLGSGVVVGITALDVAIPIFTFVFGRARESGHAALVSLARLAPEFYGLPQDHELMKQRAVAEVLHELGHVTGLRHCRDASCLMSFAGSVERVDIRGSVFCPECLAQLPRWLRGSQRAPQAGP